MRLVSLVQPLPDNLRKIHVMSRTKTRRLSLEHGGAVVSGGVMTPIFTQRSGGYCKECQIRRVGGDIPQISKYETHSKV